MPLRPFLTTLLALTAPADAAFAPRPSTPPSWIVRTATASRRPASSSSGDAEGAWAAVGGDDDAPAPVRWTTIPLKRPEEEEAENADVPFATEEPSGGQRVVVGGGGVSGVSGEGGAAAESAAWSGARDVASGGGSAVESAADGVRSKVEEGTRSVGSGISRAAGTAADAVWTGARELASKGGSDVSSAARSVQDAGEGMSRAAGAALSEARDLASRGGSEVRSAAEGVLSRVEEGTKSAWTGARDLASKGGSDASSAARAAGSSLAELASAAGSTAESAGSSLAALVREGGSRAASVAEWMDGRAKDGTAATNAGARRIVLSFTGKTAYRFGDISKEVVRRASETNVEVKDVLLVLKILLALGCTIGPLAKILPITLLLDMLNTSLEAHLGNQIIEALGGAIDERFIAALNAEEIGEMAVKGLLGDAAKEALKASISKFTGKEEYQGGDIKDALAERGEAETSLPPNLVMADASMYQPTRTLDLQVGPELLEWDKTFREGQTDLDEAVEQSLRSDSSEGEASSEVLDKQFIRELDEWDRKFDSLYPSDRR